MQTVAGRCGMLLDFKRQTVASLAHAISCTDVPATVCGSQEPLLPVSGGRQALDEPEKIFPLSRLESSVVARAGNGKFLVQAGRSRGLPN